ncbi:DUF948 domain-containing protein [Petropleomorpha daqingensis]|uniref:DUF948 domain-containing protein n=1 Tax=Petropleomorpha daqingensis TaxID=2026353 RepID=A0A853CPK8_9ACTN|nr:DUF948 domain-containing protein [Petropleomorpha daqingensis]NYJ07863.1 hypothetical protein [Petropleomorpha daqingensis]
MSASEWIGLAAVVVFAALVLLLAVPLRKLGRYLDEAAATLRWTREQQPAPVADRPSTAPRVADEPAGPVRSTVAEPVDVPPPHVVAEPAPLGTVVSATLGGPLIKVASLGYGVRTAARIRQESRARATAGRRGSSARRTSRRAA